MPGRKLFLFRIEKALLATNPALLNQVEIESIQHNYYADAIKERREETKKTDKQYQVLSAIFEEHSKKKLFVINKNSMTKIIKGILQNEDQIAFITSLHFTKKALISFLSNTYDIDLSNDFLFYGQSTNIKQNLAEINKKFELSEIIFASYDENEIIGIQNSGIATCYIDTNKNDKTNGKQYIQNLRNFIQKRKLEITLLKLEENNQELNFKLKEKEKAISSIHSENDELTKSIQKLNLELKIKDSSIESLKSQLENKEQQTGYFPFLCAAALTTAAILGYAMK
ncbi:hypothetical protein L3V79_07185 [Thiotrichales bacterium 19S9-12]|nr:hypothetical protein [Thiotrichales bacterium 19S9-11]MCF6812137.1 hypothetical protein [Thiotrichales bacterium 19S9-12]